MATAADVMDRVAAVCLNDPNKYTYGYDVQLPHLKAAWEELAQVLTSVNIPITKEVSTVLTYTAGGHTVTPPADMFIPMAVFERAVGQSDNEWARMKELPWDRKRVAADHTTLDCWTWRENIFEVGSCRTNREVYCQYWKDITLQIADEDSTITIINVVNALAFRTAELCSRYMGSNTERADNLARDYNTSKDLLTTIGVKKNQSIVQRRRPYRTNKRTAFPRH
jgi:hypothetical protein